MPDQCRELLVIPPHGEEFNEPETLKRIKEAVSARFPDYVFQVGIESQFRDDSFVLIPVMGVVDNANPQPLKAPPDFEEMHEIGEFLFHQFVGLKQRPH